ncbi:MAG: radical SAM protein [Bacteroides sp.]|nr:radical SAM protein [Bacteroides sp.]
MKRLSIKQKLALSLYRRVKADARSQHPLRQLFWECTWRCNLSCLHCGSDCKSSSVIPDMPAEDFLKAIDSITPHVNPNLVNIIITGGEPLMRKDLEKVGRALYDRGYPWGIVTNGMLLTQERLTALRKSGIHSMTVSLDGLEEDHNWMRGHKASFDRALDAIRRIVEAGDITFDVVTCVNRRSLPRLDELKEILIEAGVRQWRLFTIFPAGRAAQHPEFDLSEKELEQLMEFIVATRKEGRIHPSFCCEGFMGKYEGKVRDRFFDCQAGVTVGSILLDGGIGSCPSIRADYRQGNIYEDDFMEVWNNRFNQYRDRTWMKTGVCSDCEFWKYCEGNGMHLRDEEGKLMHCHMKKN